VKASAAARFAGTIFAHRMVSDDEIGRSLRSLLTTPFQEAMERVGQLRRRFYAISRGVSEACATKADGAANDSAGVKFITKNGCGPS
jgi:hypothetical protein